MNWDSIEGNWKQFKGHVKEQWGKLTDEDLDVIAGKRDQLTGSIQETYGISRDQAEAQVEAFEAIHKDNELASSAYFRSISPGDTPGPRAPSSANTDEITK